METQLQTSLPRRLAERWGSAEQFCRNWLQCSGRHISQRRPFAQPSVSTEELGLLLISEWRPYPPQFSSGAALFGRSSVGRPAAVASGRGCVTI